jgi:hypothetical protein
MTTQELKQYIDKVLGNSIRCLLPSYWWKRLFNQVTDRIDEVEQSTSKLIESKVEEVKMPIVESVDELEKLELAKGRVAAVEKTGESATVKISDCYFSSNFEEDWDKYTIVKGIEEKDVIIDKDVSASVMFSASKETINKDALQVTAGSGIFYYVKWADEKSHFTSLEEVNKALSSGKYRAIFSFNDPDDCFIDDYFTFYSEKPQPSLYIKGDSWERLAKESDLEGVDASITVDSELSDTSENPVQNKVVADRFKLLEPIMFIPLAGTEEAKAMNAESYRRYLETTGYNRRVAIHAILRGGIINVVSSMGPLSNAPEHQYITLIWYDFGGGIRETRVYSDGSITDIETESDAVDVDTELSDTSTNPVQNKAVKAYVDNAIANAITNTLNTAV